MLCYSFLFQQSSPSDGDASAAGELQQTAHTLQLLEQVGNVFRQAGNEYGAIGRVHHE